MTYPVREHFAQNRGLVTISCPLHKCDYKHKFRETDYTVDDPKTTERRLTYLREHHKSGHLAKESGEIATEDAIIHNAISRWSAIQSAKGALTSGQVQDLTRSLVHTLKEAHIL